MKRSRAIGWVCALSIGFVGCYAGIDAEPPGASGADGGGEDDGGADDDADRDRDDDEPEACEGCVGASPLHRLLRAEMVGVVSQAFPAVAEHIPFELIPANATIGLFEANHLAITDDGVAQYGRFAEAAAPVVVAEAGCEDEDCAATFVREAASTLFRREPTEAEVQALLGLLEAPEDIPDWSLASGMRQATTALLQAPQLLYEVEVGEPTDDPALRRLRPDELARRLSLLLWRQAPPQALVDAANAGKLDTAEGVAEQAQWMLDDPRADAMIVGFFDRLLQLEAFGEQPRFIEGTSDAEDYPGAAALVDSMRAETEAFVVALMHTTGSYRELVTAQYSFADDALAEYYGVAPGVPTDDSSLPRIDLSGTADRSGILSHGTVVGRHTTVEDHRAAHRGRFVIENLMCQTLPPPPDDLVIPAIPEGVSIRDAFEQMTASPSCRGCHDLINPVGFLYEHYDGAARYFDEYRGFEVDASGWIEADGETVNGVRGLGEALASSKVAQHCMARRWFQYIVGRADGPDDQASVDAAFDAFVDADLDMRTLVVAIVSSDAFRFRRLPGA